MGAVESSPDAGSRTETEDVAALQGTCVWRGGKAAWVVQS